MSTRTTMDVLGLGESAAVVDVTGEGVMTIRLLEMGFVPGTTVKLVKRAPLGDPLEFQVRGYHVSLRRAEAATIQVARR